jgi:hypothetical protein
MHRTGGSGLRASARPALYRTSHGLILSHRLISASSLWVPHARPVSVGPFACQSCRSASNVSTDSATCTSSPSVVIVVFPFSARRARETFSSRPEHAHLLISEPASGTPSTVLKMLKQRVSRRLRRKARRGALPTQRSFLFAAPESRLPQFWQRRFHDFNVWTAKRGSRNSHICTRTPASGIGEKSRGLALEQLRFLSRTRRGSSRDRPCRLRASLKATNRKRPHARRPSIGAPAKTKPLSLGHPPVQRCRTQDAC